MDDRYTGYLLVSLSAIGFGTLGLWGKIAYQMGFSPLELLSIRFIFAAIVLWIIAYIWYRPEIRMPARNLGKLWFQGGILYAFTAIGYFYALQYLSVSIATVLFFLHPIYTYLVTAFWLKEEISRSKWLALLLTMCGIMLLLSISMTDLRLNLIGIIAILISGISYSAFNLSNQVIEIKCRGFIATLYTTTFCALTSVFFAIVNGSEWKVFSNFSVATFGVIMGISFLGTIVGILLLIQGIRIIGAAEASVYSAFEPLSAAVFAAIFLGEVLSIAQIAGMILVIGGVTLIRTRKQRSLLKVAAD